MASAWGLILQAVNRLLRDRTGLHEAARWRVDPVRDQLQQLVNQLISLPAVVLSVQQ
jgi:hypothetical protein